MMEIELRCKICDQKCVSLRGIAIHVARRHGIYKEEYYLTYLGGKRGTCGYCGKKTKFKGLKEGYYAHCCIEHVSKDPRIRKEKVRRMTVDRTEQEKETWLQGVRDTWARKNQKEVNEIAERRHQTNIERYGGKTNYKKHRQTIKEKYGVDNISQVPEVSEKIKEAWKNKTDKEKRAIRRKKRKTAIQNGHIKPYKKKKGPEYERLKKIYQRVVPKALQEDYKAYRKEVKRITDQNREFVFELWNGLDYYDGENIRENFNLHFLDRCYPTLDHKVSVARGFMDGLSPYFIGSFHNLCITKRHINNEKRAQTAEEFEQESKSD